MRLRLLLAGILLPLALWASLPMLSPAAPSGAKKLQRTIDVTRYKINRRKKTERVLSTDIAAYNTRIRRLQAKIGGLQSRQQRVEVDLDAKRAELSRLQGQLRDERARLTRLRARLAVAKTALARRLVELYQADAPDLVTVVLNADGFNQLLERGEFLSRVGEQDQRILAVVRTGRADAARIAVRLAKLEARQEAVTRIVLAHRDEISAIRLGVVGTRVGVERARGGKQQALGSVREDRQHLEQDLEVAESQQAKIRATLARAAAQNSGALPVQPIKGGGQFIWPVNGPITGNFGEQRPGHIHAGIDIAAPNGTPIRAAGDGRVALMQGVGASGGYGNYTCIQHTQTVSTCYAHQSRFGTSLGARVTQGQVIGYVGNTGHSFGDHLHFEVRVNGVPVQPLNYL